MFRVRYTILYLHIVSFSFCGLARLYLKFITILHYCSEHKSHPPERYSQVKHILLVQFTKRADRWLGKLVCVLPTGNTIHCSLCKTARLVRAENTDK